jgi:hypothetical protein
MQAAEIAQRLAQDAESVCRRFMGKVMPVPEAGCWLWEGYTDKKMGYGMFWFGESMILAHRMSYWLFVGRIPKGAHVCHKCDVPSCVNPNHLWLGTNADNVADKVRKGRQSRMAGRQHPGAKLTEQEVIEIRDSGLSARKAARKYGVHRSTIKYIRKGKRWACIRGENASV